MLWVNAKETQADFFMHNLFTFYSSCWVRKVLPLDIMKRCFIFIDTGRATV